MPNPLSIATTAQARNARRFGGGVLVQPQTISSVSWDCAGLLTDATGSDLFPITWSDDGNQYTAWGDGNGFQGAVKASYGFAKLEGDPASYTATDLFQHATPTGAGKVAGLISIGGNIYGWKNKQDVSPPTHVLIKSTDKCATDPTELAVSWPNAGATNMVPVSFINQGQDNASAIDGFVYSIAGDWLTASPVYLLRVPVGDIETEAAYEVYTSTDPGSPTWSTTLASRQPIYTDAAAVSVNGAVHTTVTYFPALQQFILTFHEDDDLGIWSIHTGPKPWGPWTQIASYTNWCSWAGQCVTEMLLRYIAPKWIGSIVGSSLDFWMPFSGAGVGNCDQFNLIKGTFTLI